MMLQKASQIIGQHGNPSSVLQKFLKKAPEKATGLDAMPNVNIFKGPRTFPFPVVWPGSPCVFLVESCEKGAPCKYIYYITSIKLIFSPFICCKN